MFSENQKYFYKTTKLRLNRIADFNGFWCNKSTNLGHTDTTNLKKVRDWYGKGKFIQMETLSA
ncbi:hypothetical protein EXW57_28745 (plasmid) [Bacillus mycoides]|nr:hypothetical protein EXW57_28745 [Bacillus mycoides]